MDVPLLKYPAMPNPPPFDPTLLLTILPNLPGVYRMLGGSGEILYVGKARDLKKRVSSYFQKSGLSPRIRLMVSKIQDIQITVTRSESEALLLENNLIKGLAPRYNILFRDDKSYPYVLLTGHTFPRLVHFRGMPDKRDRVFGPFPDSHAVRESLQILQKIFRLRTCEDTVFAHRSRPCLLHQIKRCSGPCTGLISKQEYARDVENATLFLQGRDNVLMATLMVKMEAAATTLRFEEAAVYRDQVQALARVREKQFVESRGTRDADVIGLATEAGIACVYLMMIRAGRNLGGKAFFPDNAEEAEPASVLEAFLSQHYAGRPVPAALVLGVGVEGMASCLQEASGHKVQVLANPSGERRNWLRMAEHNAELALIARKGQRTGQEQRLAALNEALGEANIQRIECFDVSHTQGEATVVSCVVYDDGAMKASEYRRFNIDTPTPGDDYYAMRAALTRRYSKLAEGVGKRPDLLLIDGGRGQLNVALGALNELGLGQIAIVGVAKGKARKPGLEQLILPDEIEPLRLPADHPALHLIQEVRDEAHRFAITGHRARRAKKRTTSSLEEIAGIGPKRRQRLLQTFGGLRGLQSAGIEEMAQVEGVSRSLAEKLYRALH